MKIIERYTPLVLGVNSVTAINGTSIGGFIAVTAGTLTVVDATGTTVINALPVSAGVYYPVPIFLGTLGIKPVITTAGGASGTLLI